MPGLRFLAQHHRDIGSLTLPAGQLIQITVFKLSEFKKIDILGNDLLIFDGQPSFEWGKLPYIPFIGELRDVIVRASSSGGLR